MTSCRSVSVLIAFGTIGVWACGAPTAPLTPLSPGVWGGDHVTLTVSDGATHLELDCAHGDIPGAFSADTRGAFVLTGTFVREHGGPIREGEAADSHPATYSGSVGPTAMVLTIRLGDSTDVFGPFNLVRGATGRVVKCL
jgi:hypothetical protein